MTEETQNFLLISSSLFESLLVVVLDKEGEKIGDEDKPSALRKKKASQDQTRDEAKNAQESIEALFTRKDRIVDFRAREEGSQA